MTSERDYRKNDLNDIDEEVDIIRVKEHEPEEMQVEEKLVETNKDLKVKDAEELREEIERVRYQNVLIIRWLEQAEEEEIKYVKRIKTLETILKEKAAKENAKDLDFKEQEKQVKLLNQQFKTNEEEWLMKENGYKEDIKGYKEEVK